MPHAILLVYVWLRAGPPAPGANGIGIPCGFDIISGCAASGPAGKSLPRSTIRARPRSKTGSSIAAEPFENPDYRVLLSTRDDAQSEFEFPTEMPGHVGRGWTLLQRGGGGKDPFMGYAVVSWNPDDPSDYLAAGWWFQFKNQQFPSTRIMTTPCPFFSSSRPDAPAVPACNGNGVLQRRSVSLQAIGRKPCARSSRGS